MPKIQKNKIEQCTKIFIYRDLKFFFLGFFFAYFENIVSREHGLGQNFI